MDALSSFNRPQTDDGEVFYTPTRLAASLCGGSGGAGGGAGGAAGGKGSAGAAGSGGALAARGGGAGGAAAAAAMDGGGAGSDAFVIVESNYRVRAIADRHIASLTECSS